MVVQDASISLGGFPLLTTLWRYFSVTSSTLLLFLWSFEKKSTTHIDQTLVVVHITIAEFCFMPFFGSAKLASFLCRLRWLDYYYLCSHFAESFFLKAYYFLHCISSLNPLSSLGSWDPFSLFIIKKTCRSNYFFQPKTVGAWVIFFCDGHNSENHQLLLMGPKALAP